MGEHYFTSRPLAKEQSIQIRDTLRGVDIILISSSSVFSKDHIDDGTRLLADSSKIRSGAKVLDLGCGYGAVGIAVAKKDPQAKVVLSDINERAANLAKQNALQNDVQIDVRVCNLYERIPESFDVILLNPPQTAGKKLCFDMIDQAKVHLAKGGLFYLVARPGKGGKTLAARMAQSVGPTEVVARARGFALYVAQNP